MSRIDAFERLVVGESNRLAVEIAERVVERPGAWNLNPLVIVGESGTGKTALLEAMHAGMGDEYPQAKVLFLTGREFMDLWIKALQSGTLDEFRQKLTDLDMLLLDEGEFLLGKQDVQSEIRTIFSEMLKKGRQIVFASTMPIAELDETVFEKGLQGRLCSGIEARLGVPDEEMKRAFVQRMCEERGLSISNEALGDVISGADRSFWTLRGSVCRNLR